MIRPRKHAALLLALLALAPAAKGQENNAARPPVDPGVAQLLARPYLSEAERAQLRVRYGVWTDEDLKDEALAARAALMRGAWDDPALQSPHADPIDRAEAKLRRGLAQEAIDELKDNTSLRAAALRARAFFDLGKRDESLAVLREARQRLNAAKVDDAAELAWGVRALVLLARLEGSKEGEYRAMVSMLARARDELDRLEPEVYLAEAELLQDKDNPGEADEALRRALELNPSSARAWALRGLICVDAFDMQALQETAGRLRALDEGSALADLALARGRLRQSDARGALELLERAAARYPANRDILALKAAAHAASFDDAKAQQTLAQLDRLCPENAEGHFEIGRVLSEARQYAQSAAALGEAIAREPNWARPHAELGLMEMQSGRDAEALKALTRASELDPFNVRVANSLTLVKELGSYKKVSSEHFIVRFRAGPDEVLAGEMLEPLEKIFARVTGKERGGIDHAPSRPTIIELMPDHRWFAVRIAGMPEIHTIAASTGPVIAMEAPRGGPDHLVGPYDWARVIQHEYTHTVTLSRTRNRLPHWFTEAAAVYLEDAPRDYSTCQLLARALSEGDLFDFEQINIAFVRPEKPTDRSQAYAQGHWMYEYIIERSGPRAPLEMMDRYANGEREADVFPAVLGVSREDFLKEFSRWAGLQLLAWGMALPEGTPTVPQLLEEAQKKTPDTTPTPELVDAWLAQYPEHPDLLSLKIEGELARAGGKPDESMRPLLERYAKARGVDPLPHKLLASLDLAAGGNAVEHLEFLDAREQHEVVYAMELARRYAALGEWDKAQSKALRAVRISPYDPAPRELAASVAIKRGELAAAEHQIRALLALEPNEELHKRRLEALGKLREQR